MSADVEALEDRTLLAGNVQVLLSGQDVVLIGDAADNAVKIERRNDWIVVIGLDGTTVNGMNEFLASGLPLIRDDLKVNLGDGNDSISDSGGAADVLDYDTNDFTANVFRDGNDAVFLNIDGTTIRVVDHFAGQQIETISSNFFFTERTEEFNFLTGIADTSGFDLIVGTSAGETIISTGGYDEIYAGGGDDFILSFAGSVYVNPGTGNDTIIGDNSSGGDGILYLDRTEAATFTVGPGGSGTVSIGSETDTFRGIEELYGTQAGDLFDGSGSSLNDFYYYEGGPGNDTFIGGDAEEQIGFFYALEAVTVDFTAGTAIGGASVGSDNFSGIEDVFGSRFGDTIIGDGNANFITGFKGDDQLQGGLGDDIYDYRLFDGSDTISDTGGFDTFRFDVERYGAEFTQDGNDLVFRAIDGALVRFVDHFAGQAIEQVDAIDEGFFQILTGLTGSVSAEIIVGTSGNDVIDGGGGRDLIYGGDGDDTISNVGGILDKANHGRGNDTVIGT
ncbi:MAG: hypothetical protein IID45_04770, partial [Planctomycetes bacterium]|nr:hypothetical protein [Planctomycetota bacterium]